MSGEGGEPAATPTGLRIEELAETTGISVRNIRVYQERGLLPPPRRKGRVAWYSQRHVSRLRLIAGMLERGYTFALIEELLVAAGRGLRVQDLLAPTAGEDPASIDPVTGTVDEIAETLGLGTVDSELTDRVVALGALRPAGPEDTGATEATDTDPGTEAAETAEDGGADRYTVTRPDMLAAAGALVDAGIPLSAQLALAEQVRGAVDQVADGFVSLVADHYFGRAEDPPEDVPPVPGPAEVGRLADLIAGLRPQANRVLELLLAEAMDRRIDRALALAATRFGGASGHPADPEVTG